MKLNLQLRSFWCFAIALLFALSAIAQEPSGYYNAAEGKSQAALKTALYTIIKSHVALEYYSSSTSFRSTDWHPATSTYPNGYFWDMYSSTKRVSWSGMNREHNMPKSWFGIASGAENSAPIGCDLHNLYPSDAAANSAKSNYPLGIVGANPTYNNGVVKVGKSSFPGYSGTVFEPANEYKGDFARDYMYMVTCYEDYANVWQSIGTSSMLQRNTYPVFNSYSVNLLLKWNTDDPVSEKEIIRNNAVYQLQNNRNPFIDHPELAEFLWGNRMGESWSLDVGPIESVELKIKVNPVATDLEVDLNKPELATYYVQTLNGITVQTGKFSADGKMSVSKLNNGMYFLKVYTGTKRKVGKFIVLH